MVTYPILIALSLLIILSYLFDMAAKRTRFPSVLLLISVGIVIEWVCRRMGFSIPYVNQILQLFGVIGLILIVLEAALDLRLARDRQSVIKTALATAGVVLTATALGIALLFFLLLRQPFYQCLINAIPFSVISSAVAIPCVAHFLPHRREFIVYESTFSDILGIIVFNFAVSNSHPGVGSVFFSLGNLALTVFLSALCCVVLLLFMERTRHHIKFFIVLSVLILTYAAGKMLHLHSLLVILVFGLVLNNLDFFERGRLAQFLDFRHLNAEIRQLRRLTAESAFLIRTIFFVLLGAAIQFTSLLKFKVIGLGLMITGVAFFVRFVFIRQFAKPHYGHEIFVVPRGLITILLFYSIPESLVIEGLAPGVLFLTIILSNLLLATGLLTAREQAGEPNAKAALPAAPIDA